MSVANHGPAVRERDDALCEFPSEADGALVVKEDGKLPFALNRQESGTEPLLLLAPPEAPIDDRRKERRRRRALASPSARLVRRLRAVGVALSARFGMHVLRAHAACMTGVAALCRTWPRLLAPIGALSRSTLARVARGAAVVRRTADIVRRPPSILRRRYSAIAASPINASLTTWDDRADSVRPFVLGILVGGLMVGHQRLIPDQSVTALVPESQTAPARPETGPSPPADPREGVITSTGSAQLPNANDTVSTIGRVGQGDSGRPAPRPEQRRREPQAHPRPYRGSLLVTSTPQGAAVFINGHPAGTTPVVLGNLPVGSRAVRVSLEGYDRWSRAVQVVANRRTDVNVVLTVPRPLAAEPSGSE